MRRKVTSLGLCLILFMAIFTTFDLNCKIIQTGKSETFYVDDDGGKDYTRIQDAIDNATAGSIIYVWNGTYNENVVVDKSLTIIGNSSMNTIIDANKTGDAMTIQANWVNITGFTFARPNKYKAGIKLDNAENCMVTYNAYSPYYGSSYGIHIYNSRENTIISNNFSKARCGILVNISDNNNIAENDLFGNRYGIFLGPSSNNNYIDNNNISNSKILNVDQYGIYIHYSVGNNITQNIMVENGIFISGNLIQHWNTHKIDTSNIISSKPVYYWKNRTGGIIPMGAGQIILAHCQNVTVKNQEISNSSVGIELGFSLNNDIINNNASDNYYGFYLYKSNDNLFMNNNISNNNYGIFLKNSGNNKIISCSSYSNKKYSIYCHVSNDNLMESNEFHSSIYLFSSSFNKINDNDLNKCSIGLRYSSNNSIERNTFSSGGIGLQHSSNYNTVTKNIILNSGVSLTLTSSMYNSITYNEIFHPTIGFDLYLSSKNIIANNNISLSNIDGIYLSDSDHNIILDNNISFSQVDGIYSYYSSNNTIRGNNISSNNEMGIHFSHSHNSSIIENTIYKNGYGPIFDSWGIRLEFSLNNVIYHNNIIDNKIQESDNSPFSNLWNDSYPSGGNYWSNYKGKDEKSGPKQDQPGSDGIGDTSIGSDNYPLMKPYQKTRIPLTKGFNLISIPKIQSDTSIQSVLYSLSNQYYAVQSYNNSDGNDPWKHYHTSKPSQMNDLKCLDHNMGFFIYIKDPDGTIFIVNGTMPHFSQNISLYKGWNLVGYPSFTNYNRTDALNNLTFGTHVDAIWTFNSANQKFQSIGESDYFKQGKGYYIHAQTNCVWEVPL